MPGHAVDSIPEPPVGLEIDHSTLFRCDPAGYLVKISRDYGDILSLRLGCESVLVLSHPRTIEYVLHKGNKHFTKAFRTEYRPIFGNGLFMCDGQYWAQQRRRLRPAFRHDIVRAHGATAVQASVNQMALWRDGQIRDIHKEMMDLMLTLFASSFFGIVEEQAVSQLGLALWDVNRCIESLQSSHALRVRSISEASKRRLEEAVIRLDECIFSSIQLHRLRPHPGGDVLSHFLAASCSHSGSRLSDRQLRDELLGFLQAGRETTALALTWAWLLLAGSPKDRMTLFAEVDAVLGGRPPSVADLPRLRFTESIIKESMRLFPPAAILKRKTVKACTIAGFDVRVGTSIMLPVCAVQRDSRFFDSPDSFVPSRWGNGFQSRLPRFAYLPFGGGPRQCIGMTMAMMSSVLVMATVAQQFELLLANNEPVQSSSNATLRPRNEVRLILSGRSSAIAHTA